jgi:hypothetical protein
MKLLGIVAVVPLPRAGSSPERDSQLGSRSRQISIGSGPAKTVERSRDGRGWAASDRVVRRKRLRGGLATTSYGFLNAVLIGAALMRGASIAAGMS